MAVPLEEDEFTKYEKARMFGSRALQLSMGAPFLIKISKKDLEELQYNPVRIAMKEFEAGVLPIAVRRILPHERKKT
jgi:DNA-directed RNA polymerase subunit K/omega